jgi:hypothetical protein
MKELKGEEEDADEEDEDEEEGEEDEEEGSEEEDKEVAEKMGELSSEGGEDTQSTEKRGARNTQRKEAAHRCSKLAAGTTQLNNAAYYSPLNGGGPAGAMPAPWPKKEKERLCESAYARVTTFLIYHHSPLHLAISHFFYHQQPKGPKLKRSNRIGPQQPLEPKNLSQKANWRSFWPE